jgi:hypothetical protein
MAEWSLFNTLKGVAPKLGGPLLLPFTSRKLAEDPRAKPYLPPESNRSLLNPLIPAITGIKNFIGIPGTPQTSQQEEWMKNKILQKTRESGSLNGVIDYKDYGSTTADQPSGDWTGGIMGAPFAFGNTLGKSGYSIPQQGGNVNWDKSGTSYDFDKGFIPDPIRDIVNTGGLLNQDYGNNFPLHVPSPLHYNPDIQITAKDIFDLFSGGKLMHKGETEIKPTQPTTTTNQLTPAQIQQINAMDTQLTQSQVPTSTPPVQTPVQTGPTQGQIAAQAQAQQRAQAAAAQQRAQAAAAAQAAEAARNTREQARQPTYTPPPPPVYTPPAPLQGPAGYTPPTVKPRVNNVSPGGGNSRRAGTSKNYGVTGRRVTGGR